MTAPDPKKTPERAQTNEGLREEREKADRALAASQAALADDAAAVVELARDNADAVLAAARDKADEQADTAAPGQTPTAAITEERAVEDDALQDERAAADESVRRQRAASERLLKRHLPLERDATDKYLLIERARSDDAVANRDDFLGMVCHDLRDLLNGIVVSAALLEERIAGKPDSGPSIADTARIKRYGERMNRLIEDLVDVASIDSGRLSVSRTRGDAIALVNEVVDALQAAATAKGVMLECRPMEAALPANFDHDRLLQVLANLITNSIKFTPKGGRIEVRCERVGKGFELSVTDSGQGIPTAMLETVFARFTQVGKDDRRGLGLGLYISKCIVEAHAGTIRAESTLGAGSCVTVTLPQTAEA